MSARSTLIVSLDYELFLGSRAGTPERCLVEPTDALARCLERFGARLVLFVDAGYLLRAREEGRRSTQARREYSLVATQLAALAKRGHDLQLHIHPHWEDSTFEDGRWLIRTHRYRLADFDADAVASVVARYRGALEEIKGAPVGAFRAGGWCIQPFAAIREALRANRVLIDSTVYAGGYNATEGRAYDFRAAPRAAAPWLFDSDPVRPADGGPFLEVPISSFVYGAPLFWRLALDKLLKPPRSRPYGDGRVLAAGGRYYLTRLLRPTFSPVSIDGAKARLLDRAYAAFRRAGGVLFNVMGHPKAVTPAGVTDVAGFLERHRAELDHLTLGDVAPLRALLPPSSRALPPSPATSNRARD